MLNGVRNKDQKLVGHFFEDRIFYRLLIAVPLKNAQEIWPIIMDFGQPNAEIGWKMANGQWPTVISSTASTCLMTSLVRQIFRLRLIHYPIYN